MPSSPTFSDPSQASVFALAQLLSERGTFTWQEWTEAVGAHGDWVSALEALVGMPDELCAHRAAWARAAARTPHGEPIELSPADFR